MPRKKKIAAVPLDTIREIPEPAWERVKKILDETYPPAPVGRPRIDFRQAMNGIEATSLGKQSQQASPPLSVA